MIADYIERITPVFRDITGRKPEGVVVPLMVMVTAEGPDFQTSSMFHNYLVEIPARKVEAALDEANPVARTVWSDSPASPARRAALRIRQGRRENPRSAPRRLVPRHVGSPRAARRRRLRKSRPARQPAAPPCVRPRRLARRSANLDRQVRPQDRSGARPGIRRPGRPPHRGRRSGHARRRQARRRRPRLPQKTLRPHAPRRWRKMAPLRRQTHRPGTSPVPRRAPLLAAAIARIGRREAPRQLRVWLLPQLGYPELFALIDPRQPWDAAPNRELARTCPSATPSSPI